MNYHGIEVTSDDIAEVFAGFFDKKVVGIVESTRVDPGVILNFNQIFTSRQTKFKTNLGLFLLFSK